MNSNLIDSLAKKAFEGLVTDISDKIKQIIQNRIVEYIAETARKCSFLKTILHKDNVNINNVYFPLRLASNETRISPKNCRDLFLKNNRIVIEGKGGSGKTTFIKFFYINSVQTSYKIPVLFNLRDFNLIDLSENKKKKEILNNIFYKELISHLLFNKVGITTEAIISMFDSGNFLLILDGYDELNYNIKSYLLKDIEDFVLRFPKNCYIITTRPYTDATHLTNFTSYEILGLEETKEIDQFITKQLFNNEELALSIIAELKLPGSLKYLSLLTNPLFLILFINSYESYPKLPAKKITFYWQVFDALFEKHETLSKGGFRRPKLTGLKREDFEFVLDAFSFVSYFQSQFTFESSYIEKELREIKKSFAKDFEPSDFIEDLKVTLTILIENGNELYFIHRTLQEYFTARFLTTINENNKHIFLKKLANLQVIEKSHTFLLELISEMFPNEFTQYFIIEYLKAYLENFNDLFRSTLFTFGDGFNALTPFKNFLEIITFSKDLDKLFFKFLDDNKEKYNDSHRILMVFGDKEKIKYAKQMLIVYQNKENLLTILKEHVETLSNNSRPFIDFALNSPRIVKDELYLQNRYSKSRSDNDESSLPM